MLMAVALRSLPFYISTKLYLFQLLLTTSFSSMRRRHRLGLIRVVSWSFKSNQAGLSHLTSLGHSQRTFEELHFMQIALRMSSSGLGEMHLLPHLPYPIICSDQILWAGSDATMTHPYSY